MGNPTSPGNSHPEQKIDAENIANFVILIQGSVMPKLNKTLNRENVSFPQFFLLAYLTSAEYLTMTNISIKMNFSTAAATGMIDSMENLGFVERIHATEDRRKVKVQITSQGVEFVAKMREEIRSELKTLLKGWESEASQTILDTQSALGAMRPKK